MPAPWPRVPLGDVLRHRKEFVQIDDTATYRRCRVQLHAQGVVPRDEVTGAEIKTKRQQVCRAGEFLVAEIDAKVGGFGMVPPELDGAIVSSHYFLYGVDDAKLDRRFLDYYVRTAEFREQVEAQGSTNYAAIRPADVLGYTVPLPPVAEQRRVVARVGAVAARVADARRLQGESGEEIDRLLMAEYRRITDGAPVRAMAEVAPLTRRPVSVDVTAEYPQIAARAFGRGTFHQPTLQGEDVTWQKPFQVRAGDILISNIKAWEGAIAVVRPADDGRYGSHRYLTCVPGPDLATAGFVCFHLLTPEGLYHVGEASPGSADRNRTTNTKALMSIPVPVPPLADQRRFDRLLAKADELRGLQAGAAADLDALLPAVLARAFAGEL